MEQTKEVVKQIPHGNNVYNLMVFPDRDRWLWFVTHISTSPADGTHWGRLLGCGDAPDEKAAWKQAESLVDECRKKSSRRAAPGRVSSASLAVATDHSYPIR